MDVTLGLNPAEQLKVKVSNVELALQSPVLTLNIIELEEILSEQAREEGYNSNSDDEATNSPAEKECL